MTTRAALFCYVQTWGDDSKMLMHSEVCSHLIRASSAAKHTWALPHPPSWPSWDSALPQGRGLLKEANPRGKTEWPQHREMRREEA